VFGKGRPNVGGQEDASLGAANVERQENVGGSREVCKDGERQLSGKTAKKIVARFEIVVFNERRRRGFTACGKERLHRAGVGFLIEDGMW